MVYANPAVTPGMIASLGLQPRSDSRTRVVPETPLRLTTTPQPTGAILLEWKRDGDAHPAHGLCGGRVGRLPGERVPLGAPGPLRIASGVAPRLGALRKLL